MWVNREEMLCDRVRESCPQGSKMLSKGDNVKREETKSTSVRST